MKASYRLRLGTSSIIAPCEACAIKGIEASAVKPTADDIAWAEGEIEKIEGTKPRGAT